MVFSASPSEAVVRLTFAIADGGSVAVPTSGCGTIDESVSSVDGLRVVSTSVAVDSIVCSGVSTTDAATSGVEDCRGAECASTVSVVVFT